MKVESEGSIVSETNAEAAIVQQTTFQVKDFIDAAQLKRDLHFSPTNLDDAMFEQASRFADYGVKLAQASHQVDVVKLLLESAEAAVYKVLRDQAATKAEKVTEAQLEKLVARHARVVSMKKALNEAKRVEAIGKTAVEAFKQRRDMLVQQGAVAREELKGEVFTRARSAAEDARSAQVADILARRNKGGSEAA